VNIDADGYQPLPDIEKLVYGPEETVDYRLVA